MRSRKLGDANAEVLDGHRSAALCHLANVSYRLGKASKPEAIREATQASPQWSDAYEGFRHHLETNGIDLGKTPATLGPWVTIDARSEAFVGKFAEQANALSRRAYRKPFVVPEIV